jgi:hypothetical protein
MMRAITRLGCRCQLYSRAVFRFSVHTWSQGASLALVLVNPQGYSPIDDDEANSDDDDDVDERNEMALKDVAIEAMLRFSVYTVLWIRKGIIPSHGFQCFLVSVFVSHYPTYTPELPFLVLVRL